MPAIAVVVGVVNLIMAGVGAGTTTASCVEATKAKEKQKRDQIDAAQDQVDIKIQNELIQTSKGLQSPR